jgi:hypothetical protein
MRQRMKRFAGFLKSGFVACPIRETLASSTLHCKRGMFAIVHAKRGARLNDGYRIRKIVGQTLFAAMLIDNLRGLRIRFDVIVVLCFVGIDVASRATFARITGITSEMALPSRWLNWPCRNPVMAVAGKNALTNLLQVVRGDWGIWRNNHAIHEPPGLQGEPGDYRSQNFL